MDFEYASTLAEVRGCIATLADRSPFELSVAYERLLLLLDAIQRDDVPAMEPIEHDGADVWVRLVVAMDRLVSLSRSLSVRDETIEPWCESD